MKNVYRNQESTMFALSLVDHSKAININSKSFFPHSFHGSNSILKCIYLKLTPNDFNPIGIKKATQVLFCFNTTLTKKGKKETTTEESQTATEKKNSKYGCSLIFPVSSSLTAIDTFCGPFIQSV